MLDLVNHIEMAHCQCHHPIHPDELYPLIYHQTHRHRHVDVWQVVAFQNALHRVREKRDVYRHHAAYQKRLFLREGKHKSESDSRL